MKRGGGKTKENKERERKERNALETNYNEFASDASGALALINLYCLSFIDQASLERVTEGKRRIRIGRNAIKLTNES